MTFLNRWARTIFMFSKIFLCSNHFKWLSYFLIKNNLLISETVMKLSSSSGNTWECEVMVNYRRCPHPPTGLPPSPLGFPTLISALVRLRSWGRRQAVTSAGTPSGLSGIVFILVRRAGPCCQAASHRWSLLTNWKLLLNNRAMLRYTICYSRLSVSECRLMFSKPNPVVVGRPGQAVRRPPGLSYHSDSSQGHHNNWGSPCNATL